jgi:predicted Fe-Mo cluster-binding NifX family protein
VTLAFCVRGEGEPLSLDERFGRAEKYYLMDSEDGHRINILTNPMQQASGSAGIGAIQLLADRNVEGIIAPHLGPKAEEARKSLGIKLWDQGECKTVNEAIEAWKNGSLKVVVEKPVHQGLHRV